MNAPINPGAFTRSIADFVTSPTHLTDLQTLLQRGLNTWEDAPAWLLSLSDEIEAGSVIAGSNEDFVTLSRESVQTTVGIVEILARQTPADTVPRSEPKATVPTDGWLQDGSLLYRLTDGHRPENRDEINVTMADGWRFHAVRERRAAQLLDRIRGNRAPAVTPDVDALAQFIRQVDGKHTMGAGVLAQHICDWLTGAQEQAPATAPEAGVWRELCRRLYVELFYCDQQMTQSNNVRKQPIFQQGVTVRDVLRDAKAALESSETKGAQKT